jgi:hypothetical protein
MLIAERQNQSAKPRRPWSETIAILLINKTIRRQAILPMVGRALPMVGKTLPMVGETKPLVGETKNMVGSTTMLAERQNPWSQTRKYQQRNKNLG